MSYLPGEFVDLAVGLISNAYQVFGRFVLSGGCTTVIFCLVAQFCAYCDIVHLAQCLCVLEELQKATGDGRYISGNIRSVDGVGRMSREDWEVTGEGGRKGKVRDACSFVAKGIQQSTHHLGCHRGMPFHQSYFDFSTW